MDGFSAGWAAGGLERFDASGVHRTGTAGDFACGDWLLKSVSGAGVAVQQQDIRFERTVVREGWIDVEGLRIDGLPLFDASSTDQTTLSGLLCDARQAGNAGGASHIGFVEMPPSAASLKGQALEQLRRNTSLAGIVVATRISGESLAPINAQFHGAPFGPPVLQVAGMHHSMLASAVARNARVNMVSRYQREPGHSFNVAATIKAIGNGSRPVSPAPLVLLTPRTSWWESTAERAGGLLAWIAGIQAARELHTSGTLRRDVQAYATCGHELGHIGLGAVTSRPGVPISSATAWLHLGANLGCASNPALAVRAHDANEAGRMHALLIDNGYPEQHLRVEPASQISGEGHDLLALGANVLSLAGGNAHFHAASDRWPANVSAQAVASIARAVAQWVKIKTS